MKDLSRQRSFLDRPFSRKMLCKIIRRRAGTEFSTQYGHSGYRLGICVRPQWGKVDRSLRTLCADQP